MNPANTYSHPNTVAALSSGQINAAQGSIDKLQNAMARIIDAVHGNESAVASLNDNLGMGHMYPREPSASVSAPTPVPNDRIEAVALLANDLADKLTNQTSVLDRVRFQLIG